MPTINRFQFKIVCFILLFLSLNAPIGQANMTVKSVHPLTEVSPPPVEKVKPVDKKKKKKLKKRHKKKFKQQQQKAPDQTQDLSTVLFIFLILLFILNIVGAFLFGFGLATLPIWVTGLGMMVLANIVSLIFTIVGASDSTGESVTNNAVIIGFLIFTIFLMVSDFIIGLIFLIWGASIAFPLVWIFGIGLMLMALILLLFLYLSIKNE